MKKAAISTEPYKGVRDFYPEDQAIQNYLFTVCRTVAERFGYQECNASLLEPAELYRGKTSEEIVNEQTYTFTDRGDREVTLRPEMTPSVARMIAAKRKALHFPVRWYSIPTVFRYERPQRGRQREHVQFNVDLFGVATREGDVEVISLAYEILRAFGMKDADFEIRINSRKVMTYIIEHLLDLTGPEASELSRLIDRKSKMKQAEFEEKLSGQLGEKDRFLLTLLNSKHVEEFVASLPQDTELEAHLRELRAVMETLEKRGITNVVFDQTLMRGFDYYTGIVFEVFDKHPKNARSIFGGGRYDNLMDLFGAEKIPAFGFGLGDVTLRDVLETYDLLPPQKIPQAELALIPLDESSLDYVQELAQKMRREGIRVLTEFQTGKIGDRIKSADKRNIPYIAIIGGEEVASGKAKIKELKTGAETLIAEDGIAQFIRTSITKKEEPA